MQLSEIIAAYRKLPDEARAIADRESDEAIKGMAWVPNPGPQTEAYFSKADILLFGGEPSGGKSQLILGLAFNCHERSLVMRKQYTDLDALIDSAIEIKGSRAGFNGSPPPRMTHERGVIDFGAVANPGDEQRWMGRPHDLIGIDEATQFPLKQIKFLRGWLRTTKPGQRTRTVLATNPPLTADGLWVHEMFAPWIDPQFPNPAKPGELRWAISGPDDKTVWVNGPGEYQIPSDTSGKLYAAESYTFIPSKVTDNPFIDAKDYQKRLDALPAQDREILMGGFRTSFRDQDRQLIPTTWILAAQQRWSPEPPRGVPLCSIGVDVASGGEDNTVLAKRHDGWYAPLISVPGKETPLGSDVAALVFKHLRDDAVVCIDMGGGFGGGPYEILKNNHVNVIAYKGAEGSVARTKDQKMKFVNRRTEAYWRFREALDPDQQGGSHIALPPDPVLIADLTAPQFQQTPNGYKITSKEDVTKKLQRSPDRGDAVVMAWIEGGKIASHFDVWQSDHKINPRRNPQVSLGPRRR